MGIRFSFDIGTNSIGWAVWRTGEGIFGKDTARQLLASGATIFKDGRNPKDQKSLAEMRRVPRAQRRRRDRFTLRRRDLIKVLKNKGLFPQDTEAAALASADPYEIRFRGLGQKLTLEEFGRAIFHLNQRRGFRSNRKADRKSNEKGKITLAVRQLEDKLKAEKCRTYGEFLWRRHDKPKVREREAVRIRIEGDGAKALYHFYPTREMIRHEFETLWEKQSAYYPEVLTDKAREDIADVLFRQRDLKPPKIGRCTFVPDETRTAKALPSVEAREIYERLNHLRLNEKPLSMRDRDLLATKLIAGDNLSFIQLRKALKLGSVKINYEELDQKNITGAPTAYYLKKPDHFGAGWLSLSWDEKDAFVEKLLDEPDEERLVQQLQDEYGLSETAARNCASIPLADGYSRLGPTANRAILENLIDEEDADGHVITYAEAVKRAGWHHSDERDGIILDRLPYYGEVLQRHILPGSNDSKDKGDDAAYWGRITNPTVHIGLNQLRRLVNALIERFGHPAQIIVELARELKLNAKDKERLERENRQNREQNEKRAEQLAELQLPANRENLTKLRLLEEQQRANSGVAQCPYTGETINIGSLFSNEVEIDHILPVSRTLDDGLANKVLCYRQGNRDKRNQTPHEAFGDRPDWPDILARVSSLRGKSWRFQPDAMEKFEGDRGFLQRQLNETKQLSRLSKIYLGKICNPDEVYVTPGKLVGLLRGKWGLHEMIGDDNRKNRDDHRHHAIDAIVIGTLSRGLINYISREAGRMEAQDLDRVFGTIPYPADDFREQVRASVDAIVVRYKPEHGKQGALHEDTAYGIITDPAEAAEIGNLVVRKPLKALTDGEVDRVRDAKIRADLQALKAPLMDAKGKVKDVRALAAFLNGYGEEYGIRRIRIGKFDKSAVPIRDRRTGEPYKAVAPGENAHIDVVSMRDGSWQGFAATVYEVNQKDYRPEWERLKLGGKLVMRLRKGDMVELYDDRLVRRVVKVVVQIEISANRLRLAAHNEGGALQKRHDDEEDPFRWDLANIAKLKERGCVAVLCDPTGQLVAKRSNVTE